MINIIISINNNNYSNPINGNPFHDDNDDDDDPFLMMMMMK